MSYFVASDVIVIALLIIVFIRPISKIAQLIYEAILDIPETLISSKNKNKKGEK